MDLELTELRLEEWVKLMMGVLMKLCWFLQLPGLAALYPPCPFGIRTASRIRSVSF